MRFGTGLLLLALIVIVPAAIRAEEPALDSMTHLTIEPDAGPGGLIVRGADSRLQLLVTGRDGAGRVFDLTTRATFG